MKHSDLNARFAWTADHHWWDSWRRLSGSGYWLGDCDDYAVTALYIAANESWLRFWWWQISFQACFWFTRTEAGTSHMMVWQRSLGWVDNTNPHWGPRKLSKRFPVLWPLVWIKLAMGLAR